MRSQLAKESTVRAAGVTAAEEFGEEAEAAAAAAAAAAKSGTDKAKAAAAAAAAARDAAVRDALERATHAVAKGVLTALFPSKAKCVRDQRAGHCSSADIAC
jgi:hypothetical protein